MAIIPLTQENFDAQVKNLRRVVSDGTYLVSVKVEPRSDDTLAEYLKTGIHTDDSYGPFSDTDSLFASLDSPHANSL